MREEESFKGKKCMEDEEDEEEGCTQHPRHPTPPDGGWGWWVVLASFVCNLVVDGICFSFGAVNIEYQKAFNASRGQVGWVGSSLAGCYLLVGPFVSAMCQRYGCRKVTMVGSIVAMAGFALSTQSSNLQMLTVTYGVIGGIGFGMIYLPSIVCVGYWFERKRAFATGIAVCGSGLGQFIFPPFAQYLLTEYGWEGKNLIIAGIALNCAVCGMLFLPLDRLSLFKQRKPMQSKVEIERGAIMKALIEDKKRQRTISNGSLDNCIITRDNRLIKLDPKIFECKRNNSFIARFKRQLGFSSQSLACSKNSLQGIPSIVIDAVQKDLNKSKGSPIYIPNGTITQHLSQQQLGQKRGSLPDGYVLAQDSMSTNGIIPIANGHIVANGVVKTRSCDTIPKDDNPWQRAGEEESVPLTFEDNIGIPSVTRSASDLPSNSIDGSIVSIQVIPNGMCDMNSVRSLRYRSNNTMVSGRTSQLSSQVSYLTNSMLSIPQFQASMAEMELEEIQRREHSFLWKCWEILCDMFDVKVLFTPIFALFALSTFVTLLAFYIPYFFLPDKGFMIGMSVEEATFLLSIVGVTNVIGRLLCGWLADRPWMSALHLNNGAMLVAGLSILAFTWCETGKTLAVFAALFGLCGAVIVSLRSVLLVELIGLEMLTKSFGLLILFQGVAALIGAPIAGRLADTTGNLDDCFYMAGGLTILSGLLMIPVVFLRRNEVNRKLAAPMPEAMPAITETLKIENLESQI